MSMNEEFKEKFDILVKYVNILIMDDERLKFDGNLKFLIKFVF